MARPKLSGPTITVACKLPHGLILRVFDMVESDEAVSGGGFRTIKRAQPRAETVEIKGYLAAMKTSKIQMPSISPVWAFTENVNKEFFERWLKENQDHEAVVSGMIFAHDSDTAGKAREFAELRNGVEPIDPEKVKGRVTTYKADDTKAA